MDARPCVGHFSRYHSYGTLKVPLQVKTAAIAVFYYFDTTGYGPTACTTPFRPFQTPSRSPTRTPLGDQSDGGSVVTVPTIVASAMTRTRAMLAMASGGPV
jgi:hypothetical protein